MTNFGIVLDGAVVCDPIAYSVDRFRDIIQRQGMPIDLPYQLEGALHVGPVSLLPGRVEYVSAPGLAGYQDDLLPWVVEGEALVQRMDWAPLPFDHAVSDIQQHIAQSADRALGVLERGYTEREVKTWPQQRAEAAAWSADNAVSVPLLQGLADRRGVALVEVVTRVQNKVGQAAALTGVVLGDSQAAGDEIKALQALAENDQLPADWFDQLQSIAQNWRKDWPPELLSATTE